MIVTKDLVILNLPKTGSTFVRKVIKDIYYKRSNRNLIPKVFYKSWPGLFPTTIRSMGFKEIMTKTLIPNLTNQYGCFDQIPNEDKSKKILSVVRDPYLRLESQYLFRSWAQRPPIEMKKIKNLFPNFPDLTFQQYLQMKKLGYERLKTRYDIDIELKIGQQSIQFIRFFFRNHKEVLASLTKDYITKGYFKKDLCNVTLLRNENLNEELALFLSKFGFTTNELNFIKNHGKVNVTKRDINKSFLDQDVIDFVNDTEWILFEILSSFGINYKRV